MKNVLLVDDEVISVMFLKTALEDEGYIVKSARRAQEAVDATIGFEPDVLLSDFMLEGQTGADLARELLSRFPLMKVVFVTGLDDETVRERSGELPISAIVVKPVDIDEVVKVLQES